MGAYSHVAPRFATALRAAGLAGRELRYRGRPAAASTATGSFRRHAKETRDLIASVLGPA